MQYVLALIGGGLLVLILTLIPMGLSALQKLWVAGMAAVLSLLLLLVKEIYPLPLAIILVLLCTFVAMYGFWKKANFLFVSVSAETSAAIDLEEDKMIEENPSFQMESIKVAAENDDNTIKRDMKLESDERINPTIEVSKHSDELEIENDLFLKLEEIDEFENEESELASSVSPQLLLDEVEETIEEVDRFIAEHEENTENSSEEIEFSELDEIEEIDFSARIATGYEEEEDKDEDDLDGFFDDFIREAELEEVESASTEEANEQKESALVDDEALSFEDGFEEEIEKEQDVDRHEKDQVNTTKDRAEIDEIVIEDGSEETVEPDEEVGDVVNESKQVATQMLTLLHDQAQSYKANGLIREYEHITEQLLSSSLDDVMYFSIAAEYRDHLIEATEWTRVQKLLDKMAFRCKYPMLQEEIGYFQLMVKNNMMK